MKKIILNIFLLSIIFGHSQDTSHIKFADFPPLPINDSAYYEWIKEETHKLKEKHHINCDSIDFEAIIISFVVDTNGNVTNPNVLRGFDPVIDKEALEIVCKMELKWKPGKHKGEKVAVLMYIPFDFCPNQAIIENKIRKKKKKK